MLVIAHRLEIVLMAERVFILNGEGKLQEHTRSSLVNGGGTAETLLSNGLVI